MLPRDVWILFSVKVGIHVGHCLVHLSSRRKRSKVLGRHARGLLCVGFEGTETLTGVQVGLPRPGHGASATHGVHARELNMGASATHGCVCHTL